MKTFKQFQEGLAANVARVVGAGAISLMGLDAIRKMGKNKKKMEKGEEFRKGSTMDNIQKKKELYKQMGITK
tara:strand:+ start:238 stop:453 length:216 start_codon:yes stop_codon:yes gene_type:complete